MKILSIENCRDWSWSCVLDNLSQVWTEQGYSIQRLYKEQNNAIPAEQLDKTCDIFLLQNVDSLFLFSCLPPEQCIVRLGGLLLQEKDMPKSVKLRRYEQDLCDAGFVISTNNTLAEKVNYGDTDVCVIPNGVDLEYFKPTVPSSFVPFVVGFAGNVGTSITMQYKGYSLIVNATCSMYPEVILETALYKIKQLPHKDMPTRFYHKIHCLINASVAEGCSNVITEALACGVPVICTKAGYHGEYLTHLENCLFIERTPTSIQEAILTLKNNPDLWKCLSVNGRKFAEEHHCIQRVAAHYDTVFQTILANTRR